MSNVYSRKEFIGKAAMAGALLTVPEFLSHCASPRVRDQSAGDKDQTFSWHNFPIAQAALIAITAPNPHNAQAWKLRFNTPESLTLFVDTARLLPEADPPARQTHIGHGTFIELLRMAAASQGDAAEIKLFPLGGYGPGQVGTKPVATIKLSATGEIRPDILFRYWQERMTNRTEYTRSPITADEFEKLRQLTSPAGSTLHFIGEGPRLRKTADFIYRAMEIEMNDQKCSDETYQWFRMSESDIAAKADGLNLRGNGMSGFKLWLVRTFILSESKESFQSRSSTEAYLESYRKVADSSRGVVLFISETNTPVDWVRTGFDYMRFHMAATSLGLCMQPVSQVLQEYSAMTLLRTNFEEEMQVRKPRKIQMMVRLGRSDYRYFAPRRPLKNLLV